MKKIVTLILAASALALAGCSTLNPSKASSQKSVIESVLAQRAKLENEQVSILNGERVAGSMAIDVHSCPPDFRSAWFDYLVEVQTLHTRVERVAGVALAVGKPVSDLPSLIKFAATSPEVGQYLLTGLGKVDDSWAKVERAGMNYGVMPKVASKP
jgi:uncharacterized protein YcfL